MKKIISLILALCLMSSFAVLSSAENYGTVIPLGNDWIIEANSESNSVMQAFDGSRDTYWHSYFRYANGVVAEKAEYPHVITVTFPEKRNVSGWRYTTRNDNASGIFLSYEIYASEDGVSFKLIYKGDMPEYATGIDVAGFPAHVGSWGNVSMKAIKISVTKSRADHGTAAEIEFFENGEGETVKEDVTFTENSPYGDKLSNAGWTYTASTDSPGNPLKLAFDGNKSTYWHTPFTMSDGKTVPASYPHYIEITLPEKTKVSGVLYYPRTDNAVGSFQDYKVYLSTDGVNFALEKSGTFPYTSGSAADFKPSFVSWEEKEIKAVKIETERALANHGTCAEIELYSGVAEGAGTNASDSNLDERMGTMLSRDGWKYSVSGKSDNINLAFDGYEKTNWHSWFKTENGATVDKDPLPHTITIELPALTKVSGWGYTPRTDNASGTFTEYNIYTSVDGISFELAHKGSFGYASGPATDFETSYASWGDKEAKFVKIEATKTLAGHGTAAEINLFTGGAKFSDNPLEFEGEAGEYSTKCYVEAESEGKSKRGVPFISRKGWQASVSSDQSSTISQMFDGNKETYWHTNFKAVGGDIKEHDLPPHYILIILPKATEISGLSLLPRQDAGIGSFFNINVYAAENDDDEWTLIKEDYACSGTSQINEIYFSANIKVKKLRIEATNTKSGYGTMAELNLLDKDSSKETVDYETFKEYEEQHSLYRINKTLFKATSNTRDWETHSPSEILDGADDTFWQSISLDHGTVATLTIDMGNIYEVKRIDCVPRETQDFHGCWFKATLYASVDGDNWDKVLEDVTFEKSLDINEFVFETPVKARYFEFEIYEYFAERVSLGEIYFYQDLEGKKAFEEENMEKYVLKISSKEISYKLKGEEGIKEIDVAPFIVNGSTMIPLRGLLELMGAEITWYGDDQSIDIDDGTYFIHLQIDNKLVYVKHPSYGDIRYTLLSIPVIVEGRTFIPLRFVSEHLGYNVEWNGDTQEITISSK